MLVADRRIWFKKYNDLCQSMLLRVYPRTFNPSCPFSWKRSRSTSLNWIWRPPARSFSLCSCSILGNPSSHTGPGILARNQDHRSWMEIAYNLYYVRRARRWPLSGQRAAWSLLTCHAELQISILGRPSWKWRGCCYSFSIDMQLEQRWSVKQLIGSAHRTKHSKHTPQNPGGMATTIVNIALPKKTSIPWTITRNTLPTCHCNISTFELQLYFLLHKNTLPNKWWMLFGEMLKFLLTEERKKQCWQIGDNSKRTVW